MTDREAYHHGDLRRALLDRAEQVVDAQPDNELSMRSLAADVGVSITAPKSHFQSKADLLSALAARGFDRLRDATSQPMQGPANQPRAMIEELAKSYLQFSQDHPGLYKIMFASGLDHDSDPALQHSSSRAYANLRNCFDQIFPENDPAETEKRILAAWALVHGFATLLNNGPFAKEVRTGTGVEALAEIAAATVFESS